MTPDHVPADPVAGEGSAFAVSLSEGWVLWDSLKSHETVHAFVDALDALDAPDLRNALVAARSDGTVAPTERKSH